MTATTADSSKDIPLPLMPDQWQNLGISLDMFKRIRDAAGGQLPPLDELEKLLAIQNNDAVNMNWLQVVNLLRGMVRHAKEKGFM